MDILTLGISKNYTDKKTQEYENITNGLRYWRSKLADAANGLGIAKINVICDSIGEGYGSDATPANWINTSYVGMVRNKLASKYGDVGRGIIPSYFPKDAEFMVKSGFAKTSGFGFANFGVQTNVIGSTLTFSFNGTGLNIFYVDGSGAGDFTYQIDGGSTVNVNTVDPLTWAKKLTITGLSDGEHTCIITQNQSGTTTYILGFAEIKGTYGVQVNMVGKESANSNDTSLSSDRALLAEFSLIVPDLTIIECIANDYGAQTDLETYRANIQKIITNAKAGGGDVLITSVGMENIAKTIAQTSYLQVLKELASTNNLAFLDLFSRWGDAATAETLGLINSDHIHLGIKGSRDVATAILKVIDEY